MTTVGTPRQYSPGDKIRHGMLTVKITHVGPELYLGDLQVRTWIGNSHNDAAIELADKMNREIWSAAKAD